MLTNKRDSSCLAKEKQIPSDKVGTFGRSARDDNNGTSWTSRLFLLAEKTKAYTKLNSIDAGIGRGKPGVGNMHVAHFGADVVFATEEMQACSAAGSEIDAGCSFRDFGVGKERAATKFEIRDDAAARGQRPFEGKGIYANAVSGVRFLNNYEDGDGVHRIFQATAQETGSVRLGENQTVTKTHIPDSIAGLAAIEPVAAAGPNLQFMASLDGAGLRANCWRAVEENKKEDACDFSLQRKISLKYFDPGPGVPDAEKI